MREEKKVSIGRTRHWMVRRQKKTEQKDMEVDVNMSGVWRRENEYHMTAHSPEEMHLSVCSPGHGLNCDVRIRDVALRFT